MKTLIKRKYVKFLLFGLAVAIIAATILFFCLTNESEEIKGLNSYKLNLSYDDDKHKLSGSEEISYFNSSDNSFENILFHLYPNAFREGAKAKVVSEPNKEDAYPNGESYGEIKILKVFNKAKDLSFEVTGEDENILSVKLDEELFPNETADISIQFEVCLPNINHRFGYGDNTVNFGNFYPIACMYEEGVGFMQELYHSNGDPFYSDVSNYEVEIAFNSNFIIAASGEEISSSSEAGITTSKFKADKVRDFCFVLSDKFEKVSKNWKGVQVNYYGYQNDDNLERCLQTAVAALSTFNDMIGDYPYSQLSVVKANFVHGGMEFPNIVLVSDKVEENVDLNYVIIHEIAHQWWYGLVGNDQYNHAWIDEGLAEYSTLLFFEKHNEYGENFNELIKNANNNYIFFEELFKRVTGKVDGRMDRPLDQFETEPEYTNCTYTKGVLMFNSFRQLIGKNKFEKTLKNIYDDFKYKNISPAQLIAEFRKYGGRETESFFNNWLQGKVVLTKL